MNKIDQIFDKGLQAFNEKNFYDAHEYWEEIWTEYRLPDAKFVQGLIQLSVGFYHLTNKNLNGARGLFKKCQNKFENYDGFQRGLSVDAIQSLAKNGFDNVMEIGSYKDFNWDIYYPLERNN
jgi:predicted metal-dependent hydrolase